MAYNNLGAYLSTVNGGASCGGWGIVGQSLRLDQYLTGPYFMGMFFIDTGVDAPPWTTISDPAAVYQGKAWFTSGTSYNQNLTSGQLCGDFYIEANPTYENPGSFLVASGTPSYRVFLKCEAYCRNIKAYVQADGSNCYFRIDSVAWALIKV